MFFILFVGVFHAIFVAVFFAGEMRSIVKWFLSWWRFISLVFFCRRVHYVISCGVKFIWHFVMWLWRGSLACIFSTPKNGSAYIIMIFAARFLFMRVTFRVYTLFVLCARAEVDGWGVSGCHSDYDGIGFGLFNAGWCIFGNFCVGRGNGTGYLIYVIFVLLTLLPYKWLYLPLIFPSCFFSQVAWVPASPHSILGFMAYLVNHSTFLPSFRSVKLLCWNLLCRIVSSSTSSSSSLLGSSLIADIAKSTSVS